MAAQQEAVGAEREAAAAEGEEDDVAVATARETVEGGWATGSTAEMVAEASD